MVLFYVSLYSNTQLTFGWSADGKTLTFGPIFSKRDSGNSHQTKYPINFQFRYYMHKTGVYIKHGLLNSTAATQEMENM